MSQVNTVTPNGMLQIINDNFEALAPVDSMIGIGNLRLLRCVFDTAANDNDGVSNKAVGAHKISVAVPAHSIFLGGFQDVNTALTSADSTATVAVHLVSANDIQAAAQVNGAPYSTVGRKAVVPKINTPESTSLKTTAESFVTVTVAVQALTAGKITFYLPFVEGIASA